MSRAIRPATTTQRDLVAAAVIALRDARDYLRAAGCPRAAEKARKALASAEGAERHVSTRMRATANGERHPWCEPKGTVTR